jgi:KEOPS complex subunit Cgi121
VELVTGGAKIEDLDAFLEEVNRIGEETDCAIQAFDARYVAGPEQLERAVTLANRSFERGENVARERSVEILLYAAGRRQINRALEIGVSEGASEIVIAVDGEDGGDEDRAVAALCDLLDGDGWRSGERADSDLIEAFYGITDAERAATDASLVDLVCERVALLEVEK